MVEERVDREQSGIIGREGIVMLAADLRSMRVDRVPAWVRI